MNERKYEFSGYNVMYKDQSTVKISFLYQYEVEKTKKGNNNTRMENTFNVIIHPTISDIFHGVKRFGDFFIIIIHNVYNGNSDFDIFLFSFSENR